MKRTGKQTGGWVLLWMLAMALAGPGCARFRNKPLPAPPMPPPAEETGAEALPDANLDSGEPLSFPKPLINLKLDPSEVLALGTGTNGALAITAEDSLEPKEEPVPRLQLRLDPAKVQEMQRLELEEQRGEDVADIQAKNGFTRWLDGFHERLYCRMDNAVRRVDTMWLTEDTVPYDYELSTFKLKVLARVGGRSNDDSTDYKVKFRADLALPGLKRKLHLFLDNAGRDSLPGVDPMEKEDDTRLGARVNKPLRHSDLDLGGGARWRDSGPVGFAELDWRWKWDDVGGGRLRLTPRGYYYSDDGFGQQTTLVWTRPVTERKMLQFRTAERSTEMTEGLEFEQTFRFAWLRASKHRGLVMQMSVFPHYKDSSWKMDDAMLNLMWRGALYRKWIYYTLTPQVDFPREDDYRAMPSFRIGIEILMGGKIDELM